MKYAPYMVVVACFVLVILFLPPRTTHFYSPSPPRIVRRGEEKKLAIKLPTVSMPVLKLTPVVQSTLPPALVPQAAPVPVALPTPQEISIDLRSVVVIKCVFKNEAGNKVTAYGSGVIINAEGYVLTARHVVDMAYMYAITGGKQGLVGHSLDSCRIAVPPTGVKTPTPAEIRTINPFTPVTEFTYGAELVLVPPAQSGMSVAEYDFADSALIRIVSSAHGEVLPAFTASPMKIVELPARGDAVVSFGFPSGVPAYGSNFYLQGSVGEIKDIVGGDQLLKNQPMGMTVTMETIGGRSGSPVFWRGYVIGTVSAKEDYSRNTAVASIFPLARFAEDAGIAVFK